MSDRNDKVQKILMASKRYPYGTKELPHLTGDEAKAAIEALIAAAVAETEKAYGGCHKCYGKGYATVSDRWIGHDTDTDIGSPGGTVTGGKDFAMKFCSCDRGQQLEKLIKEVQLQARGEEK